MIVGTWQPEDANLKIDQFLRSCFVISFKSQQFYFSNFIPTSGHVNIWPSTSDRQHLKVTVNIWPSPNVCIPTHMNTSSPIPIHVKWHDCSCERHPWTYVCFQYKCVWQVPPTKLVAEQISPQHGCLMLSLVPLCRSPPGPLLQRCILREGNPSLTRPRIMAPGHWAWVDKRGIRESLPVYSKQQ